ncbi:MAG TPA: Zn-ribbon domain-containing OB-fold protein [Vicinamibacteria bacterium]|nr:Zn-ribbon domain-containing OB-fold protein [Vicinamibacteria bacterium]
MAKLPSQRPESLGGFVVHGVPFPMETSPEALAFLKKMAPLRIEQEYRIAYLHSYGQDSPWFAAATNRKLLGTREPQTGYTYATPRGHDMDSGRETEWVDITSRRATVHAFTVCHFGSEEFLPETPFVLALVEFERVNTLFLTRLLGVDPEQASLDWIGMEVRPRFLRNAKLKPTDVYFVPAAGAVE